MVTIRRERESCSFVVVKRQRIVSAFVLVHNEIWDRRVMAIFIFANRAKVAKRGVIYLAESLEGESLP